MKLDKHLMVESCCCFDLKTGGLILSYIGVFLNGLTILNGLADPKISIEFATNVLCFAIYVACIYGIHEKKPKFMVPSVIITFAEALFLIVMFVVLLISSVFGLAVLDELIQHAQKSAHTKYAVVNHHNNADNLKEFQIFMNSFIWLFLAILAATTALAVHFAKVMFSLYKIMIAEEEQNPIGSIVI